MSRICFVDPVGGAAGDMLLAALLDAGASGNAVRLAVESVLPGRVTLSTEEVRRAGVRARRLMLAWAGDEEGDKGVWMSVWVDDVDEMHKQCVAAGLEVTFPPTDMPWNVREMHVRHPDGHVFRISQSTEDEE